MLAAVVVATLVGGTAAPAQGPDQEHPAYRAAEWLNAQQLPDGRFTEGQPVDLAAETLTAMMISGVYGVAVKRTGDLIAAEGPARAAERAAYAARIAQALMVAGANPEAFEGTDYIALIEDAMDPITGAYDEGMYAHALAAIAVAGVRGEIPQGSLRHIRVNACRDGGWGHELACASGPDVDTTGLVIVAMRATDVTSKDDQIQAALGFLRRAQNDDGGFAHTPGGVSNVNSTALAVAGADAARSTRVASWRGDHSPISWLHEVQLDSGAFPFVAGQTRPNLYATVQAMIAFSTPMPWRHPPALRRDAPAPEDVRATPTSEDPAGSAAVDPGPAAPDRRADPGADPPSIGTVARAVPVEPVRSRSATIGLAVTLLVAVAGGHVVRRRAS